MRNKIINIVLIILLTSITFYVVFSSEDIAALPFVIQLLDMNYLLMAFACMSLYLFLNSLIIYIISREVTEEISFWGAVYLNFVGQYYGSITPLACGSQPSQVIVLKTKYNVSISSGSSITMKKFIVYQLVISLFGGWMFLVRYDFVMSHYENYAVFILIGLVGNTIAGLGIVLISYRDVFFKKLFEQLLRLAHFCRLFQKHSIEEVFSQIDEFIVNIEEIKKNKQTMFLVFFYTLLQIIAHFSIAYFIYLAFGQSGYKYLDLLAIQTLIYIAVSFIPTPGNAGASEGGFYIMLRPFFPAHLILYAMAFWRIINYYGNMLVSGLVILVVKMVEK